MQIVCFVPIQCVLNKQLTMAANFGGNKEKITMYETKETTNFR